MSSHPPSCVGNYERGDSECDSNDADPYPCAWRDKCGAFKAHLSKSRSNASRWINGDGSLAVSLQSFNESTHRWIQVYDIVDGLSSTESTKTRSVGLDELFELFLSNLVNEVSRDFAKPGALASPDQLYLRDHRQRHGYVTIYCRARNGHDKPLARIRSRPRDKVLEVWLPVSARVAAKLGLSARVLPSHGQFKSELVLDETNAIGIAKKIAGLVDGGKIQLGRAS